MILLKDCVICTSDKLVNKLECVDHSASKEKFQIVSCGTCGFTFTNPRPENSDLDKYYCSEMYISHTNKNRGLFNLTYQTIRKYAIRKKLALLDKITIKGTHLDIGCGTGEFLNACKEAGYKTKGIEPSKLARNQAETNYNLNVNENTDLEIFKKDEFTSISMWHVLEHIPDLKKTIKELNRITKINGKLLIAVPNIESWDADYYKQHWAAWDVPIHLWHFSKKSIKNLFEHNGFKLVKVKPMIFDAFYVSILSEKFKKTKQKYLYGVIVGLISNIMAIFTNKGHSSSIYVFEKIK